MHSVMKGLAILLLLATVLGAGAVLYGLQTMTPQVEQVAVAPTSAVDAQDVFDQTLAQVENRTFIGRVFSDSSDLAAQDCTFLTYTVRLKNRGFFPAEWIAMTVEPAESAQGRDVLQLADDGGRVLSARSQGDLTATVLHAGDASDTARTLHIVCYVLGQKVEMDVQAP